jgi:hypothetical protein
MRRSSAILFCDRSLRHRRRLGSSNKSMFRLGHDDEHPLHHHRWRRGGTTIRRMSSTTVTTARQARMLLGLSSNDDTLEMVTLRKAYFVAAKQCHPDTFASSSATAADDEQGEQVGYDRFLHVTEAYELLAAQLATAAAASHHDRRFDGNNTISKSEQESFRAECQRILGLSAEIVEECKRSHGFRQWLQGNTDSAYLWRDFLMQHGGLAPRLNVKTILEIAATGGGGGDREEPASQPHLQRRRRRQR